MHVCRAYTSGSVLSFIPRKVIRDGNAQANGARNPAFQSGAHCTRTQGRWGPQQMCICAIRVTARAGVCMCVYVCMCV
jgi:hypothetical protein